MTAIAEKLKDEKFFQELVAKRAARLGMAAAGVEARLTEALDEKRQAVLALVTKYAEGGSGHVAFKKIKALRDERLAHRQAVDASAVRDDPDDKEVDAFYLASLSVVTLQLSLVLAKAFDLNEAGDVYRHTLNFSGQVLEVNVQRGILTIANPADNRSLVVADIALQTAEAA